jgi:ribosomal protein S27AE
MAGLTSAERHNRMMERVFQEVDEIDKKAKCPRCGKSVVRERGLGTLSEICMHCGYSNFEGRN